MKHYRSISVACGFVICFGACAAGQDDSNAWSSDDAAERPDSGKQRRDGQTGGRTGEDDEDPDDDKQGGASAQGGGGGEAGQGGEDGTGGTAGQTYGCTDPANDGKPCAGSVTGACGRSMCRSGTCATVAASAGTVCRAKASNCDTPEQCDGSSLDCPEDRFDSNCTCPYQEVISGYELHGGLRTIDHQSFVLVDQNPWTTYQGYIDGVGLAKTPVSALAFNREMTAFKKSYFRRGYYWTKGDRNVPYWIPQGITGGVHDNVTMRVVGWHYDEKQRAQDSNSALDDSDQDKGVRISVINTTDINAVRYRHALLVTPTADGSGFKPVKIHAGGLAWLWPYLYVADTTRGVRVFDLRQFLAVSTAEECKRYVGKRGTKYCGYGYNFVLPQVGAYFFPEGASSTCRPKFSFIATDRGTGVKTVLSGEYDKNESLAMYSRLVRWPVGKGGKLKTGAGGIVVAEQAWYAGSPNLQGASSYRKNDGTVVFLMNSTKYSGALIRATENTNATVFKATDDKWGYMPEGIHITTKGNAWISTEGHNHLERAVYYASVEDLL